MILQPNTLVNIARLFVSEKVTNLTSPTPNSLLTVAERAYSRSEYGKAMQFIEQGLAINPDHSGLLSLEEKTREQLNTLSKAASEYG